ncbi:MAG TPA: TolC family protein, partial [Stellaceae bacterium]|nr:TolC family protein [Stellaceae bacterium]
QAVTLAATHNPTVIADTFDELSDEHTVDANRAKLLPTVSVVAEGSRYDGSQLPSLTTTQAQIYAQLSVPLYEAGTNWSMTRQAIQAVAVAKATTDDARKQAVQTAGQAWQTIVASRKGIAALEKAIVADKLSVHGMQAEQLAGTRTIVDVLNAQQQLYTDQISLAKTQHDLHVAEYTLSQQIGRLTALDLKLKVKLYDTRVHYDSVRNKWFGLDSTDK